MDIIRLEQTSSTNAYVREHIEELSPPVAVTAQYQTSGRGQRGNVWCSERDANVLLSLLYRPAVEIHPRDQFAISMAVSLAMVESLAEYGIHAQIKWPNDIYVYDRKIAGILIENGFTGPRIEWDIVGIGLNVNQTVFPPEIPNPVSMRVTTGQGYDPIVVSEALGNRLVERLNAVNGCTPPLMDEYRQRMWRGDGKSYPFLDTLTAERFAARILAVEPSGMLVLEDEVGSVRRYFFKEVSFLL